MSGCTTLVNMALGGIGHTHTQTRFSNVRTEMRCPQRPPTPNKPSTIGKFSVHRWAWRQKSSASSKESSIAVLMKLGSGCQNCRRSMGGRNDGCCGCLWRGVVHGDGKGSVGHAGVGLGWQTGKLTCTLSPASLISSSSTSSLKSRVLIVALALVVIYPCHSTLQTRRHRVVGLLQGPPEPQPAWAARTQK